MSQIYDYLVSLRLKRELVRTLAQAVCPKNIQETSEKQKKNQIINNLHDSESMQIVGSLIVLRLKGSHHLHRLYHRHLEATQVVPFLGTVA